MDVLVIMELNFIFGHILWVQFQAFYNCVNSCKIKDKGSHFLLSFWRPGWIISRTLRKGATLILQEALEGSCNTVALSGLCESFMVLIDTIAWNVLQSAQFLEQISVIVMVMHIWLCRFSTLIFPSSQPIKSWKVHFKHTPCQTSRKE